MKSKYVIVVLLLSLFLPHARAADELTLSEAIQKGLENNFNIRIARKDIEISKNNNSWGLAGRFPTLTLGVTQNNIYNDVEDTTGTSDRSKYWVHSVKPNINLNWILFDGFSIGITKDKFELLEDFSKGNGAIVVENTIQSIILTYYKVLLEKEKLKILDEVMALSKDRYDYELTRKELGASVTYDVLQAKIAYLGDKADHLSQEMNLKSAQRSFNLILGEPADTDFVLTDDFEAFTEDFILAELEEKMLSSNKTLKNQYINQEILKKEAELARADRWPTISLNLGADYNINRVKYSEMDPVDTDSYDFYANFSFSYALYAGGNVERGIVNAKISEAIGKLKLEEMKLSLRNQLRTTYELYNLRKELLDVARESVEAAKLNLQISGEKFKAGAINSFNYRDVQLSYLNSAFNLLQSIYYTKETHTELMRLTGGIISEE